MYQSIELFAGCGGLALGMEMAGFHHIMLNDFDKYSIGTLRANRPNWNCQLWDIANIDFKPYLWQVDFLTWWYPCQSFSYAWKKLWLNDKRGILFLEFARAIDECKPKVFMAENVSGLVNHEGGKTLKTMIQVFEDLGYTIIPPKVLKAINYKVPQKRERVFIVWVRNDLNFNGSFEWPNPHNKIYTLKEALKKWELYDCDVPHSEWQIYSQSKKDVLSLVPPGGYWRDLPVELQKEYMQWSYHLWGGKTGIARRISRDEPCLTLTCSPAQKQTERCHPDYTRPFTVREYARIQTFPDNWMFYGSINQQYKQIWNAVPVNLGYAMSLAVKNLLDKLSLKK
jgi:DNA (cytosine-5)-methyltransferase 1